VSLYERLPIPLQHLACTLAGWQRSRQRYTPHFFASLAAWERSLGASLSELHEIQRGRLARLVEYARAQVPHYRELPPAAEHRDPAEAIARTLEAIPVLEKSTYREHSEDFLARDLDRGRLLRGKTSGTTGSALPLWWTREALAEEFASFWRMRRSLGVDLGDPNLTFNGQTIAPVSQTRPPFWRHNAWNRQTLFSLYHMSPAYLPAYVDAIFASPARFAQGYPSSLFLAARALQDAGRPLPKGRLVAVFTSSESLLAFHRETIEAGFGAPVYDRYGVSEFCVSMTQCRLQRLHVDMEFGLVEVVPEERGPDWVRGPLLVTGFANRATPLLRYRIGDVGTRSLHPCECGRAGDVFLDVDGRVEDYVALPDGRWIGRMDHVFKAQLDVAEAQILQEDVRAIEVLVVRRPGYSEASERGLLAEFRSRLGDAIGIEIHYVESIPREPNGKFRAVKSKVARLPT
jgi:phenylacetate-CoA ligase